MYQSNKACLESLVKFYSATTDIFTAMKHSNPLGIFSSRKEIAPFSWQGFKVHTKHQGYQEKGMVTFM